MALEGWTTNFLLVIWLPFTPVKIVLMPILSCYALWVYQPTWKKKFIFCCYSNRSIQFWLSANSKCIELESCAWFQFEDKPMQISYSKLFSLQFWLTISFFLFCCILSKKVKKNYMTTKKISKREMHYINFASIWAQIQPSSSKHLGI